MNPAVKPIKQKNPNSTRSRNGVLIILEIV